MSSQEEIRRFSFGLDADTFTEVEVCEKTFSFKISTEIRPSSQWSSHSSAFRRASLAVMSSCKSSHPLNRLSETSHNIIHAFECGAHSASIELRWQTVDGAAVAHVREENKKEKKPPKV